MDDKKLLFVKNGEVIYIDTESSFYQDANYYASVDNVPNPQTMDQLVTDVNKQFSFIYIYKILQTSFFSLCNFFFLLDLN